jgi:hypothetical protein
MAYVWSWAFGPETGAELETYTSWDPSSTAATVMAPTNTITHTYTGDASDRYSMQIRGNGFLQSPVIMSGSGWFSAYFYYNGTNNWSSFDLLQLWGPVSNYSIDLIARSTKYFDLVIGGTQVDTPSPPLSLADTTWHHLAVKYDMRTENIFSAEVFVDGVSIMSASRTNSVFDAETTAYFKLGGVANANVPTDSLLWSDIVIYDDQLDPNPIGQFVSRIEPYFDSADSGTWAPDTNSGQEPGPQATNLSGAVATSPVVAEADPLTGEYVRVQSRDLGTNLGLTSFDSFGFTSHLFASGSSATNIISKFKFGSPNPPFISGTAVIDGENAYAYASSGSTSWTSGSAVFLQAEISGS